MPQQVLNVPEGTPLQASLGFVANSVTINNITQSWCYVSATQTFIPPYQYGVVIQLPGTDVGEIIWKTPTSLPVGPVGNGTLSATYTTDTLPPSNGVSVFSQQTQVLLAAGQPPGNANYTMPAGCQALLLAIANTPITAAVIGQTSGVFYFSGTYQGPAVIVPVAPIADPVVQVNNATASPMLVMALFTSEPEPITGVTVANFPAEQNVNLTEVGGANIGLGQTVMAASLPVVIASDQSAVAENLTQVKGVPILGAAGTVGVDIRDIGGSPSGVLNVNIADLNGSASVVGQELMAASLPVVIASDQSAVKTVPSVGNGQELMAASAPVVIASDQSRINVSAITTPGTLGQQVMAASAPVVIASNQSAVAENLTQIAGVAVSNDTAGLLDVNIKNIGNSAVVKPGGVQGYLPALQRPTFNLASSSNAYVATVGQTRIAAPAVGSSIVLRRLIMTFGNPTTTTSVQIGTASGGTTLGVFNLFLGLAADPPLDNLTVDYGDFLVGDNLPVFVTCTVALTVTVLFMYSIVVTANWPTS